MEEGLSEANMRRQQSESQSSQDKISSVLLYLAAMKEEDLPAMTEKT